MRSVLETALGRIRGREIEQRLSGGTMPRQGLTQPVLTQIPICSVREHSLESITRGQPRMNAKNANSRQEQNPVNRKGREGRKDESGYREIWSSDDLPIQELL